MILPSPVSVGLGLFTGQASGPGSPPRPDHVVPLAEAAEQAGFDALWVSEHHGLPDGYLPAPLLALAAAAGATDALVLASGLAIAPLTHPVHLAEQAAVLQAISRGRLLLGLGIGYARHEFATFGVPSHARGRRLEAVIEFCEQVWQGRAATPPGGEHPVVVTPTPPGGKPVPIWLGGYAGPAVRRALTHARGHLIGRGDPEVVARSLALLTRDGPLPPGFSVGVNLTVVPEGPGLDAPALRTAIVRNQRAYHAIQRRDDPYAGALPPPPEPDTEPGPAVVHAEGGPEAVVAGLVAHTRRLLAADRVHVVVRSIFPDDDLDRQRRRVHALGAHVLPALRATLLDEHARHPARIESSDHPGGA